MIEITTPVGRLVGGHPMVSHPVTDTRTKQPKMQSDGVTPLMSSYVGLAIPKGAEQHWNQTEWGMKIYTEAQTSWPNGEYNAPTFAWKVTDGDSAIPNKNGIKPCDREGFPGHWVINASTSLPIKCYNRGMYEPHQMIQRKEAIKPGDYCRLVITCKGNNPSESPGVYVNPQLFELYQAGQEIILSSGPSAADTFGVDAGALPAGAAIDTNVQQQGMAPPPVQQQGMAPPPVQQQPAAPAPGTTAAAPPPVQPHPEILQGPVMRMHQGQQFTEDALRAAGWTDAQINALPTV